MKHKTKMYLYLIPVSLFLFLGSCNKDLTPVNNTQPEIKLTVEDVGVTEVWLKLETANGKPEDRITLKRNDSTIQSRITGPSALDTLIYDSGLLPNHDYTYTATLLTSNQNPVSSIQQLTTMDTTSHDFTWLSWTFGATGSSVLNDVAIISPDNIWCVGEIYTEDTYTYDSLGNWIQPYNAVHWDGSEWELKRMMVKHSSWSEPHWISLESIYAFSENDIWFSSGNLHHYDSVYYNQNQKLKSYWLWDMGVLTQEDGGIKKLWGNSSNDLYGVGSKGTIVHYDGSTWQRIESGTQDTFFDIWGINNSISNENPIYLAAFDNLYSINENHQVNNENWAFTDKPIRSVWYNNKYQVLGCGEKVFKKLYTKEWQVIPDTPHDNLYMISLRGQDVNDVFVIGNFGLVLHYNGQTWKRYFNQNNNMLRSVSYNDNIIVAAGDIWWSAPHQAIILMMKSN